MIDSGVLKITEQAQLKYTKWDGESRYHYYSRLRRSRLPDVAWVMRSDMTKLIKLVNAGPLGRPA